MNTAIETYTSSTQASAPRHILKSALTALGEGRISDVMDAFDDAFTFDDHALKLQFTDKERLSEFFRKGALPGHCTGGNLYLRMRKPRRCRVEDYSKGNNASRFDATSFANFVPGRVDRAH